MSDHEKSAIEQLIFDDARLLDERSYEEWLDLYATPCTYWVPSGTRPFDADSSLSIIFDDRPTLEQRVQRLQGRFAYSQTPPSDVIRAISNLRIRISAPDVADANCAYVIFELRNHVERTLPGRCNYELRRNNEGHWQITAKTLCLLHANEPLDEIGFIP